MSVLQSHYRNLTSVLRASVQGFDSAQMADVDGVFCVDAGVDRVGGYFTAAVPALDGDPRSQLAAVCDFAAERSTPLVLWTCEGAQDALISECGRRGYAEAPAMPIMALTSPLTPDRETTGVTTATVEAFAALQAEQVGERAARFVAQSATSTSTSVLGAWADGRIDAGGLAHRSADVVGLYWIYTGEGYRRRGLGEALTRALIADAARLPVVLQASARVLDGVYG